MLQKVALVGRCNVGKSTTFNRLIKKRIAITNKEPGTTIDSNSVNISWKNKQFTIIDTAGYNSNNNDNLSIYILKQLYNTIQEADLLLFLVDGKHGIDTLDIKFTKILRAYNKNIILVINKIDTKKDEIKQYEFYELGFNNIITISAEHNINISDLLDKVCAYINFNSVTNKINNINTTKIVFIGKSNVGKSSLINAFANKKISITCNQTYTTRDSIEIPIHNSKYLIIDTAGIPHNNKVTKNIQYLSILSTKHSLKKADITVLVISALDGIGDTEVKIARLLVEQKKPIIIVVNKWDLIDDRDKSTISKTLLNQKMNKLKFIHWVDIILFVSAKTKYNLHKILIKSQLLIDKTLKKISHESLTQCLINITKTKICITKGKNLVIKDCIQISSCPPTFIFFVNCIELVHFSYKRFIENYLRKQFKLNCFPIVFIFKKAL